MRKSSDKQVPPALSIRAIKFAHQFERQYLKQRGEKDSIEPLPKESKDIDVIPVHCLW